MFSFSDLQPVFTNTYLHRVDSDDVLICKVHCVAYETASLLLDESLCTPLADALYNSLAEDQHGNITAEFDIKGDKHTVTLNTKVTRSCDLLSVKEKLVECKKISCSVWQITSLIKAKKIAFLV